jgi:hypothetical protein
MYKLGLVTPVSYEQPKSSHQAAATGQEASFTHTLFCFGFGNGMFVSFKGSQKRRGPLASYGSYWNLPIGMMGAGKMVSTWCGGQKEGMTMDDVDGGTNEGVTTDQIR